MSPLRLSEVDVQEVVDYISLLDSHKAVGVDGIPAKFVKASPVNMAMLVPKLTNKSILSGTFPDAWKSAIVTPIPKSQTGSSLSNFRPISVLPVFSKILERFVSDQITAHFNRYHLFSQRQSGFRYGHSTQDVCCIYYQEYIIEERVSNFAMGYHKSGPKVHRLPLSLQERC